MIQDNRMESSDGALGALVPGSKEDDADFGHDFGEKYAQVTHVAQMKKEIEARDSRGWQHWDKLVRVFTVWETSYGKLRRIDIIVVPFVEWPFTLVAWTGSKVFNRMIRLHANNMGLSLSAHALMTVPDAQLVPYETNPDDPPVLTEEDVFKLIGLPYLPPHLRNA